MKPRLTLTLLVMGLLFGAGGFAIPNPAAAPPPAAPGAAGLPGSWRAKVAPQVRQDLASRGQAEFLLYLAAQADLGDARWIPARQDKGRYVYRRLTAVAARTQPAIIQLLKASAAQYRPFWILNMIWVRGDTRLVEQLATRADVAALRPNPRVHFDAPVGAGPAIGEPAFQSAGDLAWNLDRVNAAGVWALGYDGGGVVVAGQDTGYDWDHPALVAQYRGSGDGPVDHDYNWHDAIHAGDPKTPDGNPCGFDAPAPCDDDGHGTHTMGIIVGDDGSGDKTGLAPGAKWIGCRNMEEGYGTPATYAECFQWFLAPTDLAGDNPRPDLAPAVINNSWGCPPVEGCDDPDVLRQVVENVRAAGILTVQSAGNQGPACSTVSHPAAIYQASFTVGNLTEFDTIASSSSRGPVTVDGSGRLKPDIAAPGTFIRSSVPGGGYAYKSGTSMAGPHVAGLAALLISAKPELAGQVDELERLMRESAVHLTAGSDCGGAAGGVPNNTYGWGRIDALAAVLSAFQDFGLYFPLVSWGE